MITLTSTSTLTLTLMDGDAGGKKDYELECAADGTFGKIENCNPVKCGNPPDKLNVRHSTIPDLGNLHYM